jgi:hypothetical protein
LAGNAFFGDPAIQDLRDFCGRRWRTSLAVRSIAMPLEPGMQINRHLPPLIGTLFPPLPPHKRRKAETPILGDLAPRPAARQRQSNASHLNSAVGLFPFPIKHFRVPPLVLSTFSKHPIEAKLNACLSVTILDVDRGADIRGKSATKIIRMARLARPPASSDPQMRRFG